MQRDRSLPAEQGQCACGLWLYQSMVFSAQQYLVELIDLVRISFKRNEFASVVVKPKANVSLKISLQWIDQDLMN